MMARFKIDRLRDYTNEEMIEELRRVAGLVPENLRTACTSCNLGKGNKIESPGQLA